ncbi:hypothetical protein TNIN_169601 [Trichonephila inaurata madagascariensis]|uniref:Uncharacterized protein n=1 Tax=Trichonephila inaurata madagascariensis TaxID=2747483 RepID=A0A8X6WSD5_9ARAC|nr:hypothetical protein TNIN_169601 [Trichonephila inaurata madagascariensis]
MDFLNYDEPFFPRAQRSVRSKIEQFFGGCSADGQRKHSLTLPSYCEGGLGKCPPPPSTHGRFVWSSCPLERRLEIRELK